MTSQYIVVQYGNVMTGEYLNIGVFVFDFDPKVEMVYVQFLTNWDRITAAFGKDTILESIVEHTLKKIVTKKQMDNIIQAAQSPYSSLQFTPPRGSLDTPEDLVKWAAKTFLVE